MELDKRLFNEIEKALSDEGLDIVEIGLPNDFERKNEFGISVIVRALMNSFTIVPRT